MHGGEVFAEMAQRLRKYALAEHEKDEDGGLQVKMHTHVYSVTFADGPEDAEYAEIKGTETLLRGLLDILGIDEKDLDILGMCRQADERR